jgi:hypothetical protein
MHFAQCFVLGIEICCIKFQGQYVKHAQKQFVGSSTKEIECNISQQSSKV